MKRQNIVGIGRAAVIAAFLIIPGCATGLNSLQNKELDVYELRGWKVIESNETSATLLGILPGGGSFYTGNPGFGIINLLFWPLSIVWDPISGLNGARANNYVATKEYVRKLQNAEMDVLLTRLQTKEISPAEYLILKESIINDYRVP